MSHSHDRTAFIAEARALLGARGFTDDPELMTPWLSDWRGRYHGAAVGMALPRSTADVSAFVKLCGRYGIPIVPQGGNSGMSGGATPNPDGTSVLLSLRHMDRIRALDAVARQVTCEAGVVLQRLHDAAAEHRLRFPLTLGGKGSATIGGLIATNAGGTQVLRHGTMRAQVLGLEAVMADGSIIDTLTPLKKDNRGFDVKQLLIGSEGTLGIVTAATLRLLPELGGRTVAWAGMRSIQDARDLLIACEGRAGPALEGFEVLPAQALSAVLSHVPGSRSPLAGEHAWHALIELAAPAGDADRLPELAEAILAQALEQGLIADAAIASSEAQADAFWQLRDEIAPAERAIGPAMQHDISVPVARMAEFVAAAMPDVEARFPGTRAVAFGHLGDGNVHFHVLAPAGAIRGEWEETEGNRISAYVHDLVTAWQGSISAEHGIGQMKVEELGRLGDPAHLTALRAVKAALDPAGLLNPGKLIPPAPARLADKATTS